MKTLLVGLDNPRSDDPAYALSPYPEHRTGGRVVRMIGTVVEGYTATDYLRDFHRTNLYPIGAAPPKGKGTTRRDRERAAETYAIARQHGYRNIVALGQRVSDAMATASDRDDDPPLLIDVPHPSARNRAWNEPRVFRYYGRVLAGLRDRTDAQRSASFFPGRRKRT